MSLTCLTPPMNLQLYLTTKHKGQTWPIRPFWIGNTPLFNLTSISVCLTHSNHTELCPFSWKLLVCSHHLWPQLALPGMLCPQIFVPLASPCHWRFSSRPQQPSSQWPTPCRSLSHHSDFLQELITTWKQLLHFFGLSFVCYLKLAKLQGLGHSLLEAKSAQDFWHQLQIQSFSKPPSGLIICWKDTQNSLKAIILRVTFIMGKGYKLEPAKEEMHRVEFGQGPEVELLAVLSLWSQVQCCLLPTLMCDIAQRELPTRKAYVSLSVQSSYWLFIMWEWLIELLPTSLKSNYSSSLHQGWGWHLAAPETHHEPPQLHKLSVGVWGVYHE